VRSEWKVTDAKLIGIVARLAVSKGHRIFLAAAALLGRERNDARFVIVGEGSDKRALELLSVELGIAENLIWAGARRDMPAVYNALDVLCSASIRGEGFSNVIGEAMACGVPCVVTRVGDSARIVGDLGIAVAPGDARALARAWAAMLAKLDRIDRRQLRDRIVKQFGLEVMVDATEKALIEVAESGARSRLTRERARM
jgi:glycosyltransferase involved in cell wall biosynthesis